MGSGHATRRDVHFSILFCFDAFAPARRLAAIVKRLLTLVNGRRAAWPRKVGDEVRRRWRRGLWSWRQRCDCDLPRHGQAWAQDVDVLCRHVQESPTLDLTSAPLHTASSLTTVNSPHWPLNHWIARTTCLRSASSMLSKQSQGWLKANRRQRLMSGCGFFSCAIAHLLVMNTSPEERYCHARRMTRRKS